MKVPVIAAGGIADARGILAAFALGAAAVQFGTAYLLCPETKISPVYREALKNATDTDELSATMQIAKRVYALAQEQNDSALMIGAYRAFASHAVLFG